MKSSGNMHLHAVIQGCIYINLQRLENTHMVGANTKIRCATFLRCP